MKKKYALIGKKLTHSYSPNIHKIIFEHLKISGNYSLIEITNNNLDKVVKKLKNGELNGINITSPYKIDIMEYLDEISDTAKKIGAVNCVIFRNNKLIGYNTDYYGFKMIISKLNLSIKNKKNFICGSGGSARTVLMCLEDLGGDNYIVTRNIKRTKVKFINYKNLKIVTYRELKEIKNKNLIINCTPCGTFPNNDCSIISEEEKQEYKIAVDLVYNPKITKFLKGFKIRENGLLMLVGQAIKAEEIWQKEKIKKECITNIYNKVYEIVYK